MDQNREDPSEEENGDNMEIVRPTFREGISDHEKMEQLNQMPQEHKDAFIYEQVLSEALGFWRNGLELRYAQLAWHCFKPINHYDENRDFYLTVLRDYELLYYLAKSERVREYLGDPEF